MRAFRPLLWLYCRPTEKVCREELKSAIVGVLDTLMAIEGLESGEN
jgi:hypothetical protein